MFRFQATSALATSLILLSGMLAAVEPGELKKYGWHTDYASARAEARRTSKPLMVVFRCEP